MGLLDGVTAVFMGGLIGLCDVPFTFSIRLGAVFPASGVVLNGDSATVPAGIGVTGVPAAGRTTLKSPAGNTSPVIDNHPATPAVIASSKAPVHKKPRRRFRRRSRPARNPFHTCSEGVSQPSGAGGSWLGRVFSRSQRSSSSLFVIVRHCSSLGHWLSLGHYSSLVVIIRHWSCINIFSRASNCFKRARALLSWLREVAG